MLGTVPCLAILKVGRHVYSNPGWEVGAPARSRQHQLQRRGTGVRHVADGLHRPVSSRHFRVRRCDYAVSLYVALALQFVVHELGAP